jgi:Pectate lyase superfamily protein
MTVPYIFADASQSIPLAELDANFAAVANTDNIEYNPPFANSTVETVTAKLAQTISVKDFGATGDGVTLDTIAVQAALDAAQDGQTVYFPTGYYKITSVSSSKAVRLVGDGFTNAIQAAYGDSAWLDRTNYGGSVIISTTTDVAISLGGSTDVSGPLKCLQMQDLMVVGPGTGLTNIGVRLTRSVGNYVQNVLIANFNTGLELKGCQNGTYNKLACKGCDTGVYLGGTITSNQSVFYNPEIQSYANYGMRLVNAALVCIFGGLFQDAKGSGIGFKVEENSGSGNVLKGVWFESTAGTYAVYDLGLYNTYETCFFSRPTDKVYFGASSFACTLKTSRFDLTVNNAVYIAAGAGNISVQDTYIPGTTPITNLGSVTLLVNSPAATFFGWNYGGILWTMGAGSPEGVVTAFPGSTYMNTSGGANTTLYVKESGSGNTGWVAK